MANFIHQTTWCLVAIIHLGFGGRFPIGNIRTLIERNVHSHVYFIGKSSTIDLEKWNRHAIVVERANEVNQSHHVHVYCGRLESSYWRYNENYWNPKEGFLKDTGLTGEKCKHLLLNQTFKVAYIGLVPNVFPNKSDNSLIGTDVGAMRLIAEKYRMNLEFHTGLVEPLTEVTNPNSSSIAAKVYRGEYQGIIPGLQAYYNSVFFDLSNYLIFSPLRYVTRVPQKFVAFENVVRGFDSPSWLAVLITLLSFAIIFQIIFCVYKFAIKNPALFNNPGNPFDFFLITFAAFVEPHTTVWFPSWSTGKFITLLWSIFALLVVSFYTSNLRTNLIAPNLEPEINSHEDVLKYDKVVYVDELMIFLLQMTVSTTFEEVLRKVEERDTWYRPVDIHRLYPPVESALLDRGDLFLASEEYILYSYFFESSLGFPKLRISKDRLTSYYLCFRLTKYSPYTPDVNKMLTTYFEFGLFQRVLYKPFPISALRSATTSQQFETSDNIRMSLEMLWTPIILLAVGSAIGLGVFVLELMLVVQWSNIKNLTRKVQTI